MVSVRPFVQKMVWWVPKLAWLFDPRGRLTVTAGSDHLFHTCSLYVHAQSTFQILEKQNKFQVRIVISTGETVGMAEEINRFSLPDA